MPIDHGETHGRGILKKKIFVLAQSIMAQDMEISLPFQVAATGAHHGGLRSKQKALKLRWAVPSKAYP